METSHSPVLIQHLQDDIQNEINKKYILSHEYKSIVEDPLKLQNETEYGQQKMIFCMLIKKSKIQNYHEALNNARKNTKRISDIGRLDGNRVLRIKRRTNVLIKNMYI